MKVVPDSGSNGVGTNKYDSGVSWKKTKSARLACGDS
jgi:hypothetical protein